MLCWNLPVFCLFKHDVKAFGTWNTTFKSLLCLFCPDVSCSAVYWRWLWGLPVQASGPAGTTHLMVQCFFFGEIFYVIIYCKYFVLYAGTYYWCIDRYINSMTFMVVCVFQQWVGEVEINALAVMYK